MQILHYNKLIQTAMEIERLENKFSKSSKHKTKEKPYTPPTVYTTKGKQISGLLVFNKMLNFFINNENLLKPKNKLVYCDMVKLIKQTLYYNTPPKIEYLINNLKKEDVNTLEKIINFLNQTSFNSLKKTQLFTKKDLVDILEMYSKIVNNLLSKNQDIEK